MVETLDRWLAETSKSRQVVMVKQVVRRSSGGVKRKKIGKITNTSFNIGYPHTILLTSSGKLVPDYFVFSSVVYVFVFVFLKVWLFNVLLPLKSFDKLVTDYFVLLRAFVFAHLSICI